jgi:membrane protein implicated in regulation of membrane protease activity
MGYGEYVEGGLLKVLGGFVILVGIGLAAYVLYLNQTNWVIALVLFLVLLVLGAMMVSRGSYARKQNTPVGRVEDVRDK